MDIQNINLQLSKYPMTIEDKGWVYGVWYCGTSFTPSEMYGQHPPTYLKRLFALFPNEKVWLHAPSGVLPHGEIDGRIHHTVDLISRKEGCPEFVTDVTSLPFEAESIDIVETDPPYSTADSKKYGLNKYPRYKAMKEFHRVLKPNEYQVGYYTLIGKEGVGVSDEFNLIRRFKTETRAITFVNYLNGGNQDISLIDEMLREEDKEI